MTKTLESLIDDVNHATPGVIFAYDGAALGGVDVEKVEDGFVAFFDPWPDGSEQAHADAMVLGEFGETAELAVCNLAEAQGIAF